MKVLVTDSINPCVRGILQDVTEVDLLPSMPQEELLKIIGNYDGLMVRSQTKVTKEIIEASRLKIIGRAGVGVDNIDVESATQKGIIVTNSPDGNTIAAAEHTLALMFAITRNIVPACISTQAKKWDRNTFVGKELYGKTLGIVGFGRIGRHVGKVASALGMVLKMFDPYATKEMVEQVGGEYFENLYELLKVSDYITLHVPKTKETTHLINKDTLASMKQGAFIINCSRGGIINEKDLQEALNQGHIGGACLDVYEEEPEIAKCPLIGCKNVILTPHLGASTQEAQLNVAIDVAHQIKAVLSGGNAQSAINIPSLQASKLEPVKDYMSLAQNAGEFIAQMGGEKIQSIEMIVQGDLSKKNLEPLETAVLKGVLSTMLEDVNFVNAPFLAKQRQIYITTTHSSAPCNFSNLLSIKITTQHDSYAIALSLIENAPKIIQLNAYETNIPLQKYTLLIPHKNQPAMIAKIAHILGEQYKININSMSVIQNNEQNQDSLMIIDTSLAVTEEILQTLRQVDGISNPKYIYLSAI